MSQISNFYSNTGPSGFVQTLTGNTGGAVPPSLGNINVVGDGTTITIVGNPATHTLTASLIGSTGTQKLTGDTGGAVSPTAGNINVIAGNASNNAGASVLIAGNPGTSTLTLNVTDSNGNTYIGNLAGTTHGTNNIAVGKSALSSLTSGVGYIAIGNNALSNYTAPAVTGPCIAIGLNAGDVYTTNQYNTVIGSPNGGWNASANDSYAIRIGNGNIATGNTTIFIGHNQQAAPSPYVGVLNIGIGSDAGFNISSGTRNVLIGDQCGQNVNTGNDNCAIGHLAYPGSSGQYNIILGTLSGSNYSTESSNILLGYNVTGTGGDAHTLRIGNATGAGNGNLNKAFIAGINGVTSSNPLMVTINSATDQLGTASIPSAGITTAAGNTGTATGATVTWNATTNAGGTTSFRASGSTVSLLLTDDISTLNTTLGLNAGLNLEAAIVGGATVVSNTGLGMNVLKTANGSITGTIVSNTAIGVNSLINVTDPFGNSCLGFDTGVNYTSTEGYNILIGTFQKGTVGETGVTRIGSYNALSANQTTKVFIQGIFGITVGVSGVPVVVDNANQLGTVVSAKRFKENIDDMGAYSEDIYKLRPVTFNYIKDSTKTKSVGLIAEEVKEAMPSLYVEDNEGLPLTVRYLDLIPMLLNEVQKLKKEIELLKQ